MSGHILRDWFLPEDGIRREVISADIQSFLGNDATVRPGVGEVNGQRACSVVHVRGYSIRAYRNLTSTMIEDLKIKSAKWEQESRSSSKRVNYEDSRTFRGTGGRHESSRHDAGNHSPQVDAAYHQPSSRHRQDQEMMDYESSRPVVRQDSHAQRYPPNTGLPAGSYGEPAPTPLRAPQPPGYPLPPEDYIQDQYGRPIPVERGSPHHPAGYPSQSGYGSQAYASRDLDMSDPRQGPVREDPRYGTREDRYSQSREDIRYVPSREEPRYRDRASEEPRHRSNRDRHEREDPRQYAPPPPSSHGMREEQRYAHARDSREELRYDTAPRGDPRTPLYQEPPQSRYGYPAAQGMPMVPGQIPGSHPLDRHAVAPPQMPSQQIPPGYPPQPQIYDQYGQPVAYPVQLQPVEQAYAPRQPQREEAPTYSKNSSRKRGAPPEERSRHGRTR